MESIRRFLKQPSGSFFLFGPRGTGKSTWIREKWPEALWVDLLLPEVFRSYAAKPERLNELVSGSPKIKQVVIDEVQKCPELLSVVHAMAEKRKNIQFILTGSSSRKLKKAGVDLLAGRAVLKTLHPFMAGELGDKFYLDSALLRGLVPLVWSASRPEEVLATYVALYVREEVQMEGLVRNVGNFSRFLEAIGFSHASVLNVNHVSRECEVERKVVESYVQILEDLLLSFRLPVFSKRAKRELVKHSKFYFFDAGIFQSLRLKGPLDRPEEIAGAALEGLMLQHLRAYLAYMERDEQLFYWRTRSGNEVDFVIYGSKLFWAIEVKNSDRIRPEDLGGLKSFLEDYPQAKAFLVYRGKEKMKKGEILCIPCRDFLMSLNPE